MKSEPDESQRSKHAKKSCINLCPIQELSEEVHILRLWRVRVRRRVGCVSHDIIKSLAQAKVKTSTLAGVLIPFSGSERRTYNYGVVEKKKVSAPRDGRADNGLAYMPQPSTPSIAPSQACSLEM